MRDTQKPLNLWWCTGSCRIDRVEWDSTFAGFERLWTVAGVGPDGTLKKVSLFERLVDKATDVLCHVED
jgi:hypothetical protein